MSVIPGLIGRSLRMIPTGIKLLLSQLVLVNIQPIKQLIM